MGKASEILRGGTNEQVPPVKLDDELPHFVFKSKFKEDKVTLIKGMKETMPDGSARVTAPVLAEFSHYTYITDDVQRAELLRSCIKERLLHGIPIHILETTNVKEIPAKE